MIDPLLTSLRIAGSGIEAQSARLRVISENVANAQSTGTSPGANPYARQTITFASEMDRAIGAKTVRVGSIGVDNAPFKLELNPGDPAADTDGYVKMPNVNILIELADMREANRSYEANLQVAKQSGDMMSMTTNLLKDA